MMTGATILAPEGLRLSAWERAFFGDASPWGFILFARNIETPAQLARLCADLRAAVGRHAPILIDQEGGRVQRMRPPHWPDYLPALEQMATARDPLRAQWLRYRLIAADLRAVGIDVNCAPLADLAEPDTHPVLRNRLYGADPATVIAAARACAAGLLAGGVLPVLKHIPGHGRARHDSHLQLPRVSAPLADLVAHDFAPFAALADLPLGMTAHLVFEALDPDAPATTSPAMHRVIRQQIGFDGLLMTDDLSMQALRGSLAARATAALAAGCDLILHCTGNPAEMRDVVAAAGPLRAEARSARALAARRAPDPAELDALRAEFRALTAAPA